MFDQIADLLECQTQSREEPDQGTFHNGTNILDLMFPADFERAAKQPDRDVSQHPAIFWLRAGTPERLRDRKPRYFGRVRRRQPTQQVMLTRIGRDIYRQRQILRVGSGQDHANSTRSKAAMAVDQEGMNRPIVV